MSDGHTYSEPEARNLFPGDPLERRHCTDDGCDHFQFRDVPDGPWFDAAPPRR